MLHEIAVDPATFTSWQAYRYLIEKFGVEHGRLIARFPRPWQALVYHACAGCKDVEKKRIVESLAQVEKKLMDRNRPSGSAPSWLLRAEAEHARDNFHAIISLENPRNLGCVKVFDDLSEEDECFATSRGTVIARTVAAMASCVERLLESSKVFLFVDPHFDPDRRRFVSTMKEFVRIATHNGRKQCQIEFHLKGECTQGLFLQNCRSFVMPSVPRDAVITFVRWQQMEQRDHLHPRYILTDLGGIHFDSGLDEGKPGETTDVHFLSKALYLRRWNDYQLDVSTTQGLTELQKQAFSPAFKLVDRIRVVGRRTVNLL